MGVLSPAAEKPWKMWTPPETGEGEASRFSFKVSNSRKCRLISVYSVNSHDRVRHRVSRIFHLTGRAMNGDRVVRKEVVCSLYYLGEFQAIFPNIECISCEFDIFPSILFFFYFFFLFLCFFWELFIRRYFLKVFYTLYRRWFIENKIYFYISKLRLELYEIMENHAKHDEKYMWIFYDRVSWF